MNTPKTLFAAIKFFNDADNALGYLVSKRWPDGVACPHCDAKEPMFLATRRIWKCRKCRKQFSVKVGTIFEDSAISLGKWLTTVWLIANCKNGVSSYEIARDLGVTQKTAWFMLQRIRRAMQENSLLKIGGSGSEVEVDETFIGGKARNMHRGSARLRRLSHTGVTGKAAVVGLLERGGEVRTAMVPSRRRHALQGEIVKHVEHGSAVYTDAFMSYEQMPEEYIHKVIDHAERYVDGRVHTNGLENFWSLLKRGLKGTYVSVEPFHLFRYLDEQVWRYNNRATKTKPMSDADRFDLACSQIAGRRLTWKELTGQALGAQPVM